MLNRLFQGAVVCGAAIFLIATLGVYTSREAIAQTLKAALVRSVDEPGRVPFSQDAVSSCNAVNCFSTFAAVPTGKRLVVEHIEGLARATSAATTFGVAELDTSSEGVNPPTGIPIEFHMTQFGSAGASNVGYGWGFNQLVKAYVDAGSSARVTMSEDVQGTVFFAHVVISGYLVDITP
jgi:hypothetical protein